MNCSVEFIYTIVQCFPQTLYGGIYMQTNYLPAGGAVGVVGFLGNAVHKLELCSQTLL